MTGAQYLAMLRRRLSDVDPTTERFEDAELWDVTADVVLELSVRPTFQFGTYTVTESGVTPDWVDADGLLVLTKTAWVILMDQYRDQVNRGELGGSWKSGLEEESTIDTRKGFQDALAELDQEVTELLVIRSLGIFASRPQ